MQGFFKISFILITLLCFSSIALAGPSTANFSKEPDKPSLAETLLAAESHPQMVELEEQLKTMSVEELRGLEQSLREQATDEQLATVDALTTMAMLNHSSEVLEEDQQLILIIRLWFFHIFCVWLPFIGWWCFIF